jgi:hypothetical protein
MFGHESKTYPISLWVVAKIGPDGLDRQIWTKSGPNLDTIWTGFLKTGAEIPGKILCPRTRELIGIQILSILRRRTYVQGKEEQRTTKKSVCMHIYKQAKD